MGTVTEIYDYLRLLFARIGQPYCYQCGREIKAQSVQEITDRVMERPEKTRLQILAPVVIGRKGEFVKMFQGLIKEGYLRAKVDGELYDLAEVPPLNKMQKHDIDVVVDRLIIKEGISSRLAESLELGPPALGRAGQGGPGGIGRGAVLLLQAGLHLLRHLLPGAGPPDLLLQLAPGGLPLLRRAGHLPGVRRKPGRAQPQPVHPGGGPSSLAQT